MEGVGEGVVIQALYTCIVTVTLQLFQRHDIQRNPLVLFKTKELRKRSIASSLLW